MRVSWLEAAEWLSLTASPAGGVADPERPSLATHHIHGRARGSTPFAAREDKQVTGKRGQRSSEGRRQKPVQCPSRPPASAPKAAKKRGKKRRNLGRRIRTHRTRRRGFRRGLAQGGASQKNAAESTSSPQPQHLAPFPTTNSHPNFSPATPSHIMAAPIRNKALDVAVAP